MEDLCSFSALLPSTRARYAALVVYAPLGFVVAVVRLLLCLLVAVTHLAVAPFLPPAARAILESAAVRAMTLIGGVRIRLQTPGGAAASPRVAERLRHARVVVGNHVTQFDSLFLRVWCGGSLAVPVRETYAKSGWLLLHLTRMVVSPIWVPTPRPPPPPPPPPPSTAPQQTPPPASHASGSTEPFGRAARVPSAPGARREREGRAAVEGALRRHLRREGEPHEPLLIFPEGSITNGAGLMRFARGAFRLGEEVQPVALRVTCPLPLAHDTLTSSLPRNFARALFQPWHVAEVTLLPAVAPAPAEAAEETAARTAARSPQRRSAAQGGGPKRHSRACLSPCVGAHRGGARRAGDAVELGRQGRAQAEVRPPLNLST